MDPMDAHERATMELARDRPRSTGEAPAAKPAAKPEKPLAPLDETEHAEPNVGDFEREIVSPNMDEGASARLRAASAATRERKQTFGNGDVGAVLRTQGAPDQFKVLDSAVGQKFWKSGPTGAEAVAAYKKAVGDNPDALDALKSYAALSLRKAAMKDGVIDPKAFERWQAAHADALRSEPALKASFADAAKATQAVEEASALRANTLKLYQQGAIGKIIGLHDGDAITNGVGGLLNSKDAINEMRQLAREVASSPDARDGLRRAVADYMAKKFISNREAGVSGENAMKGDAFQTFVRQKRSALAQIFKPEEVKAIEAIANDIALANRSVDAVKLPGRSNTAQDTNALAKLKGEAPKSHLSTVAEAGGAAAAGLHFGGPIGMAAGVGSVIGKHLLGNARAAGIEKVNDLVQEMILHPDLARAALERSPVRTAAARDIRLRQQINRIAAINAGRMVSQRQDQRP
jgi:hypothetical protein